MVSGNINDIMREMNNVSPEDLFPLSNIRTQEDLKMCKEQGYLVSYTRDEWSKKFPTIPACHVFFLKGVNVGTVYYDGINYLTLPVYGDKTFGMQESWERAVQKCLADTEKQLAKKDYLSILRPVTDGMRPAILKNILKKCGPSPELYNAFVRIYSISECDVGRYAKLWDAVLAMKTDEQKEKTRAALETRFPGTETVRVYRGWADGSTPLSEAYSWTTDYRVAVFFACRRGDYAKLAVGDVRKEDIVECMYVGSKDERGESEVLIEPGNVSVKTVYSFLSLDDTALECAVSTNQGIFQEYRNILAMLYQGNDEYIHGIEHSLRVLLFSLLIAELEGVDTDGKIRLAEAAVFHDAARRSSGIEPEHGTNSSKLYLKYGNDPVVAFLVEAHCAPDHDFDRLMKAYKLNGAEEAKQLAGILKDADALDRVRFGLNAWENRDALDVRFLRTQSAIALTSFAAKAVEQLHLPKGPQDAETKDIGATLRALRRCVWLLV